jgi:hypothetical protein
MQRFLAVLRFYISFAPAGCWLVTIACAWVSRGNGGLPLLIFLKALTLFFVYLFVNTGKKKELFFYYNLGLSKEKLFTYAFALDLILFATILYAVH